MDRIAGLVAGPRRKYAVLAAWLGLVAVAVSFAGQVFAIVEDSFDTFLADGAESREVLELQRELLGSETSSVVVVYERRGGVTASDRALATAHASELRERYVPQAPSLPVVPAADGEALLYRIPISTASAQDAGDLLIDVVRDVRETVSPPDDGLDVFVTGPGATSADSVEVFEGLETTLLLAPVLVVTVLLLLIYRSPVLFLIPLLSVLLAYQVASAVMYGLAKTFDLTVNSLGAGVLGILVYALGTDYALLLISRYRQELRHHPDKHKAMRVALARSGPAILGSASTVAAGMLCFLLADQSAARALGPIGAVAAFGAVAAMTTLLPALLLVFGRWVFWPAVPRPEIEPRESHGVWRNVASLVGRRPRIVWVVTTATLAAAAVGIVGFNTPEQTPFRDVTESEEGQAVLAAHYAAGAGSPADIVAPAGQAADAAVAASRVAGVVDVEHVAEVDGRAFLQATLAAEPDTDAAYETIDSLRDRLAPLDALVGGPDAVNLDRITTATADTQVVLPVVLVAVLLILCVLLRALVAPLLMIATMLLSFGAALGLSVVVFESVLGWNGQDANLPVLAFVFLVALGVDYNIFLLSRVREEATVVGTQRGVSRGLVLTGGVITSAGIVLAATFSVLITLPVTSIAELGFVVAVGVLLDTLIVRSLLMPALALDVGRGIWWPGRLARTESRPAAAGQKSLVAAEEK